MPGVDVPQFMADQGRQGGLALKLQEDTPGDPYAARWKGVGVNVGGVQRHEPVGKVLAMGYGGDLFPHTCNVL